MLVVKAITKQGAEKYYAGKDKKGKYILTSNREKAKKYKTRSGSVNGVIYALEQQGMTADYEEEQS